MSKSLRSLCVSFSRTASGLYIYLFQWSNLNFLQSSQWITFPTQSCLVLYSFCARLLHSLIIWLIFSSPSPHYYFFLFWGFFTSALVNDFYLEFEWQQVSSSLRDSSQYSGIFQLYSSFDGLHSSCYFQVLQSLYLSFVDCNKSTNHNWYYSHFHIPQPFQFLARSRYLSLFSHSFNSNL